MRRLASRLLQRFNKAFTHETNSLVHDDIALSLLRPFIGDYYIPWSGAALRPAAICAVLNDIVLNRRKMIVEFGSGISTYFIARALEKHGGELISFDNDSDWQDLLRERLLRSTDTRNTVTLVHAALKTCDLSLDGSPWYDMGIVERSLPSHSIDLCLVDGPASFQPEWRHARYPAIPVIKGNLSQGYSIYLDDVLRDGEAEVFRRWQDELGISGSAFADRGGFGLIRTPGTYFTAL